MNHKDAKKVRKEYKYLIGKEFKGSKIVDLVLAPTDPIKLAAFINAYYSSPNRKKSIIPFKDSDLKVRVVGKHSNKKLRLAKEDIFEVAEELGKKKEKSKDK